MAADAKARKEMAEKAKSGKGPLNTGQQGIKKSGKKWGHATALEYASKRDDRPWGTTDHDERRDDTMTVSDMEPEGVYHLLERDTSIRLGIFRMLLWLANSNAISTTPLYSLRKITNNAQGKGQAILQ
jgi:hypothetical protein